MDDRALCCPDGSARARDFIAQGLLSKVVPDGLDRLGNSHYMKIFLLL